MEFSPYAQAFFPASVCYAVCGSRRKAAACLLQGREEKIKRICHPMNARVSAGNRPPGRPRKYNEALAERLCDAIADGLSLKRAAALCGVGPSSVRRWMDAVPGFKARYARACELRLLLLEEKLLDLCEEGHDAAVDSEGGSARLRAVKLEIDTIKWQLSKLLPRQYGEKSAGAEGELPLSARMDREEMAVFAEMLAAARARIGEG